MKFLSLLIFFCLSFIINAQETEQKPVSLDINYFYGTVARHTNDISHLITGHPQGLILSYNRKTYGHNAWERRYNYPDWGFSFSYQDLDNQFLGENYGIYGHYNFYFLNRHLLFRVGQGIAIASNPFDIETNIRNNAFGSRILSSTFLMANYKQQLFNNFGLQTGLSIIHYSNANVRAPNSSTNTIAFNFGLFYDLDSIPELIPRGEDPFTKERLHYNVVFRSGANETDFVGLGQRPFYIFSGFVDKKLNHKSTIQLGVDVLFSLFLIDQIRFESIAFPGRGVSGDEDYRRIGAFIGHELRFGRIALVSQLGYYVYAPFDFEGRIYERLGLKRYFGDRFFGTVTVRAHAADAEAVEFGVGIRL